MKKNSIQIREYQPIVQSEKKIDGYVTLNPHAFEQLENFILQNRTSDTDHQPKTGHHLKYRDNDIHSRHAIGSHTVSDKNTIDDGDQ